MCKHSRVQHVALYGVALLSIAMVSAGPSRAQLRHNALPDQTPPEMLNGIAMDEDGYLWVTDMTGSQLLQLEAPGTTIVARYGRDEGVDGPDDLVIDPDFVYYTAAATLAGAVGKLDRRTGRATTLAATGIGTNPIAWGPDGKLLAGLSPAASAELGVALGLTGLFEIEPVTGDFKLIVPDDKGINAFCFAPDGYVYGPHGLWGTDVLRIDLHSGEVTSIHEVNMASSVRYNPRDQHLYALASETETRAILVRMALDGSDYSVFARMSNQPNAFMTSADNFVIAPDGTFYVTRFLSPIITRISADGTDIQDFPVGQASADAVRASRDLTQADDIVAVAGAAATPVKSPRTYDCVDVVIVRDSHRLVLEPECS